MMGGSDIEEFVEFMLEPSCTGLPDFACDEAFLLDGVFKSVSGTNSGPSGLKSEFDVLRGSEPARVRRPSILLLLAQRKL